MVEFAGYSLPLQYSGGIKAEHIHTREAASLFDVSHMGQIVLTGKQAASDLESRVVSDIEKMEINQQRYTLLTNEQGGIVDDLMITRLEAGYLIVANAANKHKVMDVLNSGLSGDSKIYLDDNRSLIALQGPEAASVMNSLNPHVADLHFMQVGEFNIAGLDCRVHRSGYTGEDGFEISVDNADAEKIVSTLIEKERVRLAGLGARDSLRLEAGLCLHGQDINEMTTPVEANLQWTIAKRYLQSPESAKFTGNEVILGQILSGARKKRVGLKVVGKRPVRAEQKLLDDDGKEVGIVSSGGYSITLGTPIAMAYVDREYALPGKELTVKIQNRCHTMQVEKLPFVTHRYKR